MKDLPNWLTLFSTTMLGLVTVYFAYRSRQLERKQARQINREFDRDLIDAETEIERGRIIVYLWEQNWRAGLDSVSALEIYARARENYTRPDLPKVLRVLSFHLPSATDDASKGLLKLYASLDYLDLLLGSKIAREDLLGAVAKAEGMMAEARENLDRVRFAVHKHRRMLCSE